MNPNFGFLHIPINLPCSVQVPLPRQSTDHH